MPQKMTDQVNIDTGRVESLNGKTVPRHVHPQRERKPQMAPDGI